MTENVGIRETSRPPRGEPVEPSGSLSVPLSGPSRIDEITDRLITAIAIGEYLPGSKLPPERELAAALRVGRMTVRAALARLVEHGLLETARGRGGGSFVREAWAAPSGPSVHRSLTTRWEDMLDTSEAVSRLQGTLARAAAENRTDDDIETLRLRLDAFRAAESGLQSQKADEQLHLAIGAASHNATLQGVVLDLDSRISISAPSHLWGEPEGMLAMERRALSEHEQLVGAICDGRADDASAIAREHARIDVELLESALRRAGAGR